MPDNHHYDHHCYGQDQCPSFSWTLMLTGFQWNESPEQRVVIEWVPEKLSGTSIKCVFLDRL